MLKYFLTSAALCTFVLPAHAGPMLDKLAETLASSVSFSAETIGSDSEVYQDVVLTSKESTHDKITIETLGISVFQGKNTYIADGITVSSPDGTASVTSIKFSGDLKSIVDAGTEAIAADALSDTSNNLCERLRMPAQLSVTGATFGDETTGTISIGSVDFSAGILLNPVDCLVESTLTVTDTSITLPDQVKFTLGEIYFYLFAPADGKIPVEPSTAIFTGNLSLRNFGLEMGGASMFTGERASIFLSQDADTSIPLALTGFNNWWDAVSFATSPSSIISISGETNVGAVWNALRQVIGTVNLELVNLRVPEDAQLATLGQVFIPMDPTYIWASASTFEGEIFLGSQIANQNLGHIIADVTVAMLPVDEENLAGATVDDLMAQMPFGLKGLSFSMDDSGIADVLTQLGFDPYAMTEENAVGMLGEEKGALISTWLEQAKEAIASISIMSEAPLSIEDLMLLAMGSWDQLPSTITVDTAYEAPVFTFWEGETGGE